MKFLTETKGFILTGLGIITFSNFIISLFGQTIPNTVLTFFKDVGEIVIIAGVFAFAFAWVIKARPPNRPKKYNLIIYDVFGNESSIDGLRTEFKNHDVAWSFMKLYKKSYPLFNFALVSDFSNTERKTIFRYI